MTQCLSLCGCLVLVSLLVVLPSAVQTDEPIVLNPVKIGGGPLLVFKTSTNKVAGDTLRVFDPQAKAAPQLVSTTAYPFHSFHRLERDVLLFQDFKTVHLLNLTRGTMQPLVKDRKLEVLYPEGKTIFLQEQMNERDWGFKLDPGKDGDASISGYPQPVLKLLALKSEGVGVPVPVDEDPFERILADTKERFWLIRGKPPALWTIGKDGKGKRKVFEFEKDVVPPLLTSAFSPDGQLLAVGMAKRNSFFRYRDLLVIDLGTGKVVFRLPRIHVEVSSYSSNEARLECTWLSDQRLRFSESVITKGKDLDREGHLQWVDLDIRSGKRLRAKTYSQILGLAHSKPPTDEDKPGVKEPARVQAGMFEQQEEKLFYRGAREPIAASVPDLAKWNIVRAAVSPDGRWAAFKALPPDPNSGGRLYAVDGEKRIVHKLHDGFCEEFVWLPGR